MADIVGCGLTHGAWEQATIPNSKGGIGISDPVRCWAEARIAAMVGFHGKATTLVGLPATIVSAPIPDTPQVLAKLSGILGPNHDPISQWVPAPSSLVTADLSFAKQAWWAGQVAEARRARPPTFGTARDFVCLANQEGPFASAWFSAIPKQSLNNILPDTDFRSLCKFWLGLPLLPEGTPIMSRCL